MPQPDRIFIDMDGVLVDYYAGVCRAFGRTPWPYCCRLGEWNFFRSEPLNLTDAQVAPIMGREFYANLDWLPDGGEIVTEAACLVGEKNVYLLTSPWDTEGCRDGKADWVKRHLPDYYRRLLIGSPKEACSYPGSVLLDDSEVNCRTFAGVKNPGRAVLVPRPWNARHAEAIPENGMMRNFVAVFDAV